MCFGSKQDSKTTVTTPPQSEEEKALLAQYGAISNLQMQEMGYEPVYGAGAFNAEEYLRLNPDVAADPYFKKHPEEHYQRHGQAEGWRQTGPQTVVGYEKRPLTAEEQVQADRDTELNDLIYKKLTGQISDEDRALVEQEYTAASDVGTSNIQAEFNRTLEQLGLGESRGYEDIQREIQYGSEDLSRQLERGTDDINRYYKTEAAERGLMESDTPILGERADKFMRFGEDVSRGFTRLGEEGQTLSARLAEDVARNKRLLGEDVTRNTTNLQTSLQGAKAGAMLDVGQSQQLFAQGLREFQAQLEQNAITNRMALGESFANTSLGLGALRTRNYTQTGSGSGSSGQSTGQGLMGIGNLMQGAGSIFSSLYSASSRDFKEDIEPLELADLDKLLRAIEDMPIYTWKYKPEFGDGRVHTGPVVEESPDNIVQDKYLVPMDCIGMLFGAVKALKARIDQLEAA